MAAACRTCGFTDCPAANGGLCPRWPAAAPMDLVPGAHWGDEMVQVRAIDLASVILRIEEADRQGRIDRGAMAAERLVTCDAPRLRSYLPASTLAEMDGMWGGPDG